MHIADHREDRAHDGARRDETGDDGDHQGRDQAHDRGDQRGAAGGGLSLGRGLARHIIGALDLVDRVFDRCDVVVGGSITADHLDGLGRATVADHRRTGFHDILVPGRVAFHGLVDQGGAVGGQFAAQLVHGRQELAAMRIDAFNVVGVLRQEVATEGVLLARHVELGRRRGAIDLVFHRAHFAGLLQLEQARDDDDAHDGDRRQNETKGREQLAADGHIFNQLQLSIPRWIGNSERIGGGGDEATLIGFACAVAVGVVPAQIDGQGVSQLLFGADVSGVVVDAAVGHAVGDCGRNFCLGGDGDRALQLQPPGLFRRRKAVGRIVDAQARRHGAQLA